MSGASLARQRSRCPTPLRSRSPNSPGCRRRRRRLPAPHDGNHHHRSLARVHHRHCPLSKDSQSVRVAEDFALIHCLMRSAICHSSKRRAAGPVLVCHAPHGIGLQKKWVWFGFNRRKEALFAEVRASEIGTERNSPRNLHRKAVT
jgi:hypothetical protein